ncbi:MAG: hypothetical protein NWS59_00340, partial [Ilumatobacteraceae bacterium]|nr:hypothetical protein [Ilumatobacteraceae bacterium]
CEMCIRDSDGGGGDGDGGGDDGGDSTPPPTVPTTVPVTVPPTVPTTPPTTVPAAALATRSRMPTAGVRPAVGSAIPTLPTSARELAPEIRLVSGNLRIALVAPKGALVHVYHNGVLVRSVTAKQAKNLTMAANGADVSEMQFVVVTRDGEVLASPAPASTSATDANAKPPAKTKAIKTKAAKTKAVRIRAAKAKAAKTKAALRSASDKTKTK